MSDNSERGFMRMMQQQAEHYERDMKSYAEACRPNRYCNGCPYFTLEHDPDIYDWFEDNLQKAVCHKLEVVIGGSLDPWECSNIERPLYCPELDCVLTPEEKEQAARDLEFARKRTSS